jgi:hypothetical protein
VVDEEFLPGVIGDEAEAFFFIEPFHFAAGHSYSWVEVLGTGGK